MMTTAILWRKFSALCKKYWQIIVGFFAGLLALLAVLKRGPSRDMLKKKGELNDGIRDSEQKAREELEKQYKENIERFAERNKKIDKESREKLLAIDDDKKKRVEELMSSDKPEEEIASALKDLLK